MGTCDSKELGAVETVSAQEAPALVPALPAQGVEALPQIGSFRVPEVGVTLPVLSTYMMGWKPDLPDFRDRLIDFRARRKYAAEAVPSKVDLRDAESFPVYNQGHLGSCTANAIAACFHFQQLKEGKKDWSPSRLFIYYNERVIEDSVNIDSGAYLRDGIASLKNLGVCPEDLWPYNQSMFRTKPPAECYAAAVKNTAKEYARLEQDVDALKACLAAGYPFVFGFVVYADFHSHEVRVEGKPMNYPPQGGRHGGHAVHCCGYDDAIECFIVRNSWGAQWGDKGHFYMPYKYMTDKDLAHDFWVIRLVDGEDFPAKAVWNPSVAAE